MGSGCNQRDSNKGPFSHLVGAGQYHHPPVAYPPQGYAYPYPPHGGYPPHVCPLGYPPVAYPTSSASYYQGHGHGLGTFLAGGAIAVAASHGGHHGYGSHGYGCYGYHRHHGKFKHYRFKRAKFGKHRKHGRMYGKHKMWK